MSVKSQEANMRRLAKLLGSNLSYIWGDRETGPNGDKWVFLNTGKVFLRALGKDLGLHDCVVHSNAAGIAVSGECTLNGMWGPDSGLNICIGQADCMPEGVFCYWMIRNSQDFKGGRNHYILRLELAFMQYERLLEVLREARREKTDGRAA